MDGRTAKTESHGACRKTRLQERTDVFAVEISAYRGADYAGRSDGNGGTFGQERKYEKIEVFDRTFAKIAVIFFTTLIYYDIILMYFYKYAPLFGRKSPNRQTIRRYKNEQVRIVVYR